jgi:hypothetical protein
MGRNTLNQLKLMDENGMIPEKIDQKLCLERARLVR